MTRTIRSTLALMAFLLVPLAANADPISVSTTSNGDYLITLISGETADVASTLEDQDWFDNEALALELTALVANAFGIVNPPTDGPYFVYSLDYSNSQLLAGFWEGSAYSLGTSFDNYTYAVAYNSVPEPGTLALFGIGLAGLGLARRRKRTA